jgi:hypothetical protein
VRPGYAQTIIIFEQATISTMVLEGDTWQLEEDCGAKSGLVEKNSFLNPQS